jgi:hypothetical protein
MVVVAADEFENKTKVRQRRSREFRDELQEKFASKVVEDLVKMERARRGVEIDLPVTQSLFGAQTLTVKFLIPAICIFLILSKSKIARGLKRLYR